MLDEILKQIDYMAVLSQLNPKPKGSKEIWVNCPKCGKREAYIFRDGRSIICRRGNNCGQTTELLELVSGVHRPKGQDFLNACELLAKAGGAPFERKRMTPEQRLKIEEVERRTDALTLLGNLATANLKNQWDDFAGGDAVTYLQSRNFDIGQCITYGFGVIENVEELEGQMTLDQLEEVGLYAKHENGPGYFTQKWDHRLLIPLRDYRGRLCGFSGRTIIDHKQKYMNTRNTSLKDLVATELEPALTHGGTVIAVEGFLDPFKARMNGIPGVVAVGTTGKGFSAERWEALYGYGVRQVVFITDNDKAGGDGLRAALDNLDQAKQAPDLFTTVLPEGKDLDEWIDIQIFAGRLPSTEFKSIYRAREHSDRARAGLFAVGLDVETEGDRWTYLRKCMEYDAGVKHPRRQLSLINHFWPEVQEISGAPISTIREVCDSVRAEKIRVERKKAVTEAINKAKSKIDTCTVESIIEEITGDFAVIQENFGAVLPTRVLTPPELLLSDARTLEEIATREFLGIPQRSFPTLDAKLSGLRGLTILGGETNIGKTILLCQMVLGLLEDPTVCCLFVSLEMPSQVLRFRMLSHITQMTIKNFAQGLQNNNPNCMKAMDFMETGILSRLRFMHPREPDGTRFTTATVDAARRRLMAESGAERCVIIIDFIGLWPVDEKGKTETMIQKKQMDDAIIIRDQNEGGAVIGVMEMRKKNSTQDTGDRGAEDISGTSRSIYLADNIVLAYLFSDKMLLERFDSHSGVARLLPAPKKIPKVKSEHEQTLEDIKEALAKKSMFPVQLKIDKVRDGGEKGKINLMMKWKVNTGEEGLYI